MRGNRAFRSQGQDYLRTQLAYPAGEVRNDCQQILPVKAAIRIVEDDAARDSEQLASSSELLAAHLGKFRIGFRSTPVRGCLSGREANYMGLNALLAVMQQSSSKASSFIVRMGSKT